ncbi:MAG: prepilin-type N-terminal cleavage/methylation domain-containing protein [Deltaproteobacteria bacterium]|nr:prepilin-type N-terminal cleavage/methylation domain-containing protein [Deltaproteobacteria bacterium]
MTPRHESGRATPGRESWIRTGTADDLDSLAGTFGAKGDFGDRRMSLRSGSPPRRGSLGFTLLEVLVALALLSMALVAATGVSAGSFDSSNYAKHLTVATLLARGKMIDVEEQLKKDGFGDDEKEFDGDFDEEGYSKFKWKAVCRPVEVDVGQLVGSLLGGDFKSEDLPAQLESFLGAFNNQGDPDLVGKVADSQLSQLMQGGTLELIFKQVGETLKKSIREITLEITWEDGRYQESTRFVEYVVTTGRLSIPDGQIQIPATASGDPAAPGHRTLDTLLPPSLPGGLKLPPGLNITGPGAAAAKSGQRFPNEKIDTGEGK